MVFPPLQIKNSEIKFKELETRPVHRFYQEKSACFMHSHKRMMEPTGKPQAAITKPNAYMHVGCKHIHVVVDQILQAEQS